MPEFVHGGNYTLEENLRGNRERIKDVKLNATYKSLSVAFNRCKGGFKWVGIFSHGVNGCVAARLWKSFGEALNIAEQFKKYSRTHEVIASGCQLASTWQLRLKKISTYHTSAHARSQKIYTLLHMCTYRSMQINTCVCMTHIVHTTSNFSHISDLMWLISSAHSHGHTHRRKLLSHTHIAIITSINKNDKLRLMKGPAVTDQFNCHPWWLLNSTSVFIQGYWSALKCC